MKKYLFLLIAPFCLFMAGCDDDNTSDPIPTPEPGVQSFTFERLSLGSRSFSYRIVPQDNTRPYISAYIDTETFDQSSEEEFIEFVLDQLAGQPLDQLLSVGPTIFSTRSDIDMIYAGTNYVLFAFGLSTDGTVTSDLAYTSVQTLERETELVDIDFDIELTDIQSDGVTIQVTPTDNTIAYMVFAGERALVDQFNGDAMLAAMYTVVYLEEANGWIWTQMGNIPNVKVGASELTYSSALAAGTAQVAMVFVVNENGEVVTNPVTKDFVTGVPEPSGITFDFDIQVLTFNESRIVVTPSRSGYSSYYTDIVVKEWFETEGFEEFGHVGYTLDQEGLAQFVYEYANNGGGVGRPGKNTRYSTTLEDYGTLKPDTEYILFAATMKGNMVTSEVQYEIIKTPSFDFKSGGQAYVDQIVRSMAEPTQGGDMLIITIGYTPNEHTEKFYVATCYGTGIYSYEYMSQLTGDDLKKAVVLFNGSTDYGYDDNGYYFMYGEAPGVYTHSYTIGRDADGFYGDVNYKTWMVRLSTSSMGLTTYSLPEKWELRRLGEFKACNYPVGAEIPGKVIE